MTQSFEIDLSESLESALDALTGTVEDAVGRIRKHARTIDFHDVLAGHRAIALVFTLQDVRSQRPDLSDTQAWEVLQMFHAAAEDCPDPMHETMLDIADTQFPRKRVRRTDQAGRIIADYDPHGDERDNLVALLRDVMHWCEEFGEPFDEFCGSARMQFSGATHKGDRP